MTTTIRDILTAIGRLAPWDKAADWDPVGLQLGDPSRVPERVGVCHEITEGVVERAGELDLLVTYHPLIFRPLRALVAGRSPAGRALRLAEKQVAVAAVHTNFDAAPGGTADALAEAMALEATTAFGPVAGRPSQKFVVFVPAAAADEVAAAMGAAGGGVIGNYTACSFRSAGVGTFHAGDGTTPVTGRRGELNREPETRLEMLVPASRREAVVAALVAAHPYEEPAFDVYEVQANHGLIGRVGELEEAITLEELAQRVRGTVGGVVRVAQAATGAVRRVAVVPGSGADFIRMARDAGAEALITGDVGHHRAREATDAGLSIIDPGHAATERPGIRALYAAVAGIVDDIEDVTAGDTDPWEHA